MVILERLVHLCGSCERSAYMYVSCMSELGQYIYMKSKLIFYQKKIGLFELKVPLSNYY